jgi:predicted enzyme related to lactoylglutathione lyase
MVADAEMHGTPARARRRARLRAVVLDSADPERAAGWYRAALGLTDVDPLRTAGGVELRLTVGIGAQARAREPARIILNFHVDDIRAAEERLVALGAVWVRELEATRWGIIGTVLDLDGNYVQIVEPALGSPPCLQPKEDDG